MFLRLVSEMARNRGVTEHVKAVDMMARTRRMNSICKCAMEALFDRLGARETDLPRPFFCNLFI